MTPRPCGRPKTSKLALWSVPQAAACCLHPTRRDTRGCDTPARLLCEPKYTFTTQPLTELPPAALRRPESASRALWHAGARGARAASQSFSCAPPHARVCRPCRPSHPKSAHATTHASNPSSQVLPSRMPSPICPGPSLPARCTPGGCTTARVQNYSPGCAAPRAWTAAQGGASSMAVRETPPPA